jgi:hypothetical protein
MVHSSLLLATVIASFPMLFTWLRMAAGEATHRNWERGAELLAGLLLLGMALAFGSTGSELDASIRDPRVGGSLGSSKSSHAGSVRHDVGVRYGVSGRIRMSLYQASDGGPP